MSGELEVCVAEPVGGDGLINPALFPCRASDLDTATITTSATDLRAMGDAVESRMSTIDTTWSGIDAHYQAPEQDQVYTLMDPAVTSAESLQAAFERAAGHIDTYATQLSGVKTTLQEFETRAQAFRDRVQGGVTVDASEAEGASFGQQAKGMFDWVPGVDEEQVQVPWYEDGDTVDENRELLEEYAGILERISGYVATCANAVNGLVTNMCLAEVETIPAEAFTSPEVPMPWGYPRDEDRNCTESVGNGVSNFGYGIYSGAASLIGYDADDGRWGWDVAGQSWGGLGNFLGSTVVMVVGIVPNLVMLATGTDLPDGDFRDWYMERLEVGAGGWSSLVGYDLNAAMEGGDGWHRWSEDGVSTGVESVLNVGTFFIPGAGQVGAALRTGSVGARVARIAGVTADFVVPGGSFAVRGGITAVTGIRTALRLGDDVPAGPRAPGAAGAGGPRFNPAALIDDVTDLPTRPTDRTPVGDDLFGRPDGVPSTPDVRAPGGSAVPGAGAVDGPGAGAVDGPGAGGAEQPGAGAVDQPGGGGVEQPGAGGRTPDGTSPSEPGAGRPYDPQTSAPETVPAREAPQGYTPDDVQRALDDAPVDDAGRPVDPRTGEPLQLERSDGTRGWEMRWDPESNSWVAQNHGSGYPNGLPARGEAGSFGFDDNGNRMPYANDRPAYGPGQVDEVWENAQNADGEVWVEGPDGSPVQIEWEPGQPRDGVWDMGHLPDGPYAALRQRYLNHEISLEEFLDSYRDPDLYQVEHPSVNRSHQNEAGVAASPQPAPHVEGGSPGARPEPPSMPLAGAEPPGGAARGAEDGGATARATGGDGPSSHVTDGDVGPAPRGEGAQPAADHGVDDGRAPVAAEGYGSSSGEVGTSADGPLSSHAGAVPGGGPGQSAVHAGSADPAVLDAAFRAEYPELLEVNAERFDAGRPGHDVNCTRCVIAADHALAGAPASAMPLHRAGSLQDVVRVLGGTPQGVQGYGQVVDIMGGLPEGSRGVVVVDRGPGRIGHVFTVVHDRNGVVFLDAQTGRFARLEPAHRLGLLVVPERVAPAVTVQPVAQQVPPALTTVAPVPPTPPGPLPPGPPAPPAGSAPAPHAPLPVLVEAGVSGVEAGGTAGDGHEGDRR